MFHNLKKYTHRVSALVIACAGLAAVVGAIAYGATGKHHPAPNSHLVSHVSSKIAKAFPVFRSARASDAAQAEAEANQLPIVAEGIAEMQSLGSDSDATHGVNAGLAREVYTSTSTAVYLVPGNGTICHVAISEGHFAGGGCSETSVLEKVGSVGYGFTDSGYEVHGILPAGSSGVAVTDAKGTTTAVPINASGGFTFDTATTPVRLVYTTPAAGEQIISLNATPAPPAPEG